MRGPAPGPPPPHGSPHQPPPHGSPRQPPPPHGSPHQVPLVGGQPIHIQPQARYPLFPEQQIGARPIRPTIGPGGVGKWTYKEKAGNKSSCQIQKSYTLVKSHFHITGTLRLV